MCSQDKVLDVYASETECLYRIQRAKKVIYVLLNAPEIIPEDSRTWGPAIIRELSNFGEWLKDWDTLTVNKEKDQISVKLDDFKPHSIPKESLRNDLPLVNIQDLPPLCQVKSRTLRISFDGVPCYLKFARFDFETEAIAHEVQTYQYLMDHDFTNMPKLLGYVYEGQRRVIGFLLEEISGRHSNINDFQQCVKALTELHTLIVHGDLNRYNIIITNSGPKFIDFEESSVKPDNDDNEWNERAAKEIRLLEAVLADDSGLGRPFSS